MRYIAGLQEKVTCSRCQVPLQGGVQWLVGEMNNEVQDTTFVTCLGCSAQLFFPLPSLVVMDSPIKRQQKYAERWFNDPAQARVLVAQWNRWLTPLQAGAVLLKLGGKKLTYKERQLFYAVKRKVERWNKKLEEQKIRKKMFERILDETT